MLREGETEKTRSESVARERSELNDKTRTEITTLHQLKAAAQQALEKCMCASSTMRGYDVLLY